MVLVVKIAFVEREIKYENNQLLYLGTSIFLRMPVLSIEILLRQSTSTSAYMNCKQVEEELTNFDLRLSFVLQINSTNRNILG